MVFFHILAQLANMISSPPPSLPSSQEAVRQRALRAQRFGLAEALSEEDSLLERLGERAKRFGTKLMAHEGQPLKLVRRCVSLRLSLS